MTSAICEPLSLCQHRLSTDQISLLGIPSNHHMQTSYEQTPRDKRREGAGRKGEGSFSGGGQRRILQCNQRAQRERGLASDGLEQPSKLEGKDAAKASRLLSSLDLLCRGFEIPPSLLIAPKHLARSTAHICCKGCFVPRDLTQIWCYRHTCVKTVSGVVLMK